MPSRTEVTVAQWRDAFDQWDTGGWTIKRFGPGTPRGRAAGDADL